MTFVQKTCERDQRRLAVFRIYIHTVLWCSLCLRWHISETISVTLSSENCFNISSWHILSSFDGLVKSKGPASHPKEKKEKQGYTKIISLKYVITSLLGFFFLFVCFLWETHKDREALLCAALPREVFSHWRVNLSLERERQVLCCTVCSMLREWST